MITVYINNNYANNYIINDNTCNTKYMINMESNNNDDIQNKFFSVFYGIIRHPSSALCLIIHGFVHACSHLCGRVLENYFAAKIPKIHKTTH